jgi:hypothetical protein
MEFAYGTTPQRDITPYEGLNPKSPVYAAGNLTDPPVSVPKATEHFPDATATALPPELPPGDKFSKGKAL